MGSKHTGKYLSAMTLAGFGMSLCFLLLRLHFTNAEDPALNRSRMKDPPPKTPSLTFARGDILAIKGKLLANEDLNQRESDYVDLSQHLDLLLALLQPNSASSITHTRDPRVCRLCITRKKAPPLILDVVWFGKGPILFTDTGKHYYRRVINYNPIGKDKYLDESPALCGLIQSVANKNEKDRARFVKYFEKSLGAPKKK